MGVARGRKTCEASPALIVPLAAEAHFGCGVAGKVPVIVRPDIGTIAGPRNQRKENQ